MMRRASLISPPINEADSAPQKANKSVAQIPALPKLNEGFSSEGWKLVADPELRHPIMPTTHNNPIGSQVPIAPRLLSHLPMFSPTILTARASPSPQSE